MEPANELKYLKVFQKVTKLISMVLDHQQVMGTIVRELPGMVAHEINSPLFCRPGNGSAA